MLWFGRRVSNQLTHIAHTQSDMLIEQKRQGQAISRIEKKIYGNGGEGLIEKTARLDGRGCASSDQAPIKAAKITARSAIRVALIGLIPAAMAFLVGWLCG